MVSIMLGVAALVAVHSFRADVDRSLAAEARTLLGGDLRLQSSTDFSPGVLAVVDSLAAEGAGVARLTTLASMVYAPSSEETRLLQIRGVSGVYPLYGTPVGVPAGSWSLLGSGSALADPAILVQLGIAVGDTVQIGEAFFVLVGTVTGIPTEVGFQSAIGPRIYISDADLVSTGLVTFGSLSRHQVYLAFSRESDALAVKGRYRELFRSEDVNARTAREEAGDLSAALGTLSRFLSLVGLAALLLGGIGVASAIHVFVKEKLSSIAVLRCIGASQRSVFMAYLIQAVGLGAVGAGAGVALGLLAQALLPVLLGDILPVAVGFTPNLPAILAGFGVGIWVSVIFALIPLLSIRDVAPLQALRSDFEPDARSFGWERAGAYVALAASILLLSLWQAETVVVGLVFAGSLGGVLLVLWVVALAIIHATRRFFPARASYPVRQGVANLFRPRNQSVAVTLSLGFGAFVIGSIFVIESNLLRGLSLDAGEGQPNVLLFDIQSDQREPVEAMVRAAADGQVQTTAIVPSRLSAVNGRRVDEILGDPESRRAPGWAYRRSYRHTYRAELSDAETLVAGEWWSEEDPWMEGGERLPRISVERELAGDLGVEIGDRMTWDIEGIEVETEIASLREVDWARFSSNFFVVFEPGVIDDAPQMAITLASISDAARRGELERELIRTYPNVSVLDLALVQETLAGILDKVSGAIRLLAAFVILGGGLVLVGALTTSRFQRVRESALLRTLGARRSVIVRVLLAEYAALGSIGGLAGFTLGAAAAWLLLTRDFGIEFQLPLLPLFALWAGFTALTVVIGFANSRGVMSGTPLTTLRESGE